MKDELTFSSGTPVGAPLVYPQVSTPGYGGQVQVPAKVCKKCNARDPPGRDKTFCGGLFKETKKYFLSYSQVFILS